ncbi:MAG: LysR family transcriptional regulator [Burkholderiales bacterium]|nr:LysR family transcriptional regulator [Burkholderiales bacterium]
MTRRLHPPTHLLRAFVVTAQLGTMSAAAAALHLTQSAVSKQVQELEQWLGVALFARVKKRLRLTPAGQRYLLAVQPLLAQLEAATLDLMSSPADGGTLRLSVLPTFGAKWLIPRLPEFQRAHPKVLLQFVPYVQGYDFQRADLDAAIRYGEGPWPDAVSEYLTGRQMVLIAPPRRKGEPPLKHPADVAQHRLLHHVTVPTAWTRWCAQQQVLGVNPHSGIQLDQYSAIIQAVVAGMGLGLVPACLVADELRRGEVLAPLRGAPGRLQADAGYWLCFPDNRAELEPLLLLRRWLQAAAAA